MLSMPPCDGIEPSISCVYIRVLGLLSSSFFDMTFGVQAPVSAFAYSLAWAWPTVFHAVVPLAVHMLAACML